MSEEYVSFPDDLSQLEPAGDEIPETERVEREEERGKCGGWLTAMGDHAGPVKDCKNISYQEAKRIGDVAASKCNALIKKDCPSGCKVTKKKPPIWKDSCSNNRYWISVAIKYFCSD
jgi:hypothetical protein